MFRRRNVIKPTVKGLIEGMQFGFGIFREYANYWLIKYTDKEDIIWSHQGKENPELYIYIYVFL